MMQQYELPELDRKKTKSGRKYARKTTISPIITFIATNFRRQLASLHTPKSAGGHFTGLR